MRVVSLALLFIFACGSPTPASHLTSARQAASIVAKYHQQLTDQVAFEARCSGIDCLVATSILARWGKIADTATALHDDLAAAKPVDREVAKLTDDTVAAAGQVRTTYDAFSTCAHNNRSIAPCGDQENANETAWRVLPHQLDAWKPYGG